MIVIGDSHTWVFRDYCEVIHIHNPTAYNIHNHKDECHLNKDALPFILRRINET